MSKSYIPVFILALLGVADTGIVAEDDTPRAPRSEQAAIVEADNTFGLQLLRVLNRANSDSNLFISPLSISMALAMTLNGADGATREGMAHTMALNGLSQEQINQAYKSLRVLLTGLDSGVTLSMANSIWYRAGLPVREEFITTNSSYFDAVTTALDFGDPQDGPRINRWVREKTMGKIEKIAPEPIPVNLVMFLINAIYFKGNWAGRFDSNATRDDRFFTADGSTVPVKMMYQIHTKLRQYNDAYVKMAELPYGNGTFSMVIAMPQGGRTLDEMIDSLDSRTWSTWTSRLRENKGKIYLPRFNIAWEGALGKQLTALGMGIAFSDQSADFSRMVANAAPGEIHISEVRHKTYIEVNEQGAEAAGVTSVEMARRISETSIGEFVLRADRPFLFAIRDSRTGSILFVGKVMKP